MRRALANATVFLGGGRITSALLAGLHRAGRADNLIVYDRHPRKLRRLQREFGVAVEKDLLRAVARARMLVVAVRPASVSGLLDAIEEVDHPLAAVSLAAGVTLAALRARLGSPVEWIRAMPSPACRACRGLTALAFSRGVSQKARKRVFGLFAPVGTVLEIPEKQFDAFTVTYSTSHGYHALAALAAGARKLGLDRQTALTAAAHALADGILTWRESGESLDDLLREAATPGGTAATVMAAANDAGYARIVEHALRAGFARARKYASQR